MSVVVTRAVVSATAFEDSARVAFPNPHAISPHNAYPKWASAIMAEAGIAFPSGTMADYVPPTAWTPVLTFATPGNLSVTYGAQVGRVTALDDVVIAHFAITTTGFTHTTASGDAEITGLSLTSLNVTGLVSNGAMGWAGITKAGYTNVVARVPPNSSSIKMLASGSGVASSFVTAADMPTGGTVMINGTVIFLR